MQWSAVGSNLKQVVMVGLTEKVAFQQSPKGGEVAIGLAGRRVVSREGESFLNSNLGNWLLVSEWQQS